ncbi:accessory Sec system translocase SecA2 [Alkalihalobacillus deserti]|uniref:accessory Sec system translocase SecA2 n=1 Tax=Alkalihalobacillus deserti TaxID=2879466 RepID=UPI001D13F6D5|nr:accessory Sec system translocase SecA2 [Alkalihalobacillus deserti]
MLSYIKQIVGDQQFKELKHYELLVQEINVLEGEYLQFSDEKLREKTFYFKEQLAQGKSISDITVEAFAIVREASRRVLGLRHHDVQLIGGLALTDQNIAEMPTGEGKTLVATLPSYLRALEGKGVHVITVNEYLAKRDRELIGQVHEFLGLTVGLNLPQLSTAEKKAAYLSDITYGVGTEFGFDFLRDNLVYNQADKVQRPFHFAIIDEIDSVLIDEAKTPLILAAKSEVNTSLCYICAKLVKTFTSEVDYTFDPLTKAANLTEHGITKVEKAFGIDNLYDLEHQTLYHFVIQALRAHVMFKLDVDYIVTDGELKLIDMFTGRIMEGRSFSDGLHQALEAKENLDITEENKTQAMITIQNYYRMYPGLSGMTGTAKTEEKEFQALYSIDVIQVPTNKPRIRIDHEPLLFMTKEAKYQTAAEEVKKRHVIGQPVLIGTTSIQQSEEMAAYLENSNIPYQLLNAKSVENEAKLISLAGQKHQVTIATNMAGRGTDIELGEGVSELGGLFVLGTERHESRRVDNQLKGRSGRQGDRGETQLMTSVEDDIVQRYAQEELDKAIRKFSVNQNGLITSKEAYKLVDKAQKSCENHNYSIREYILQLDNIVNEQRSIIYQKRNEILKANELLPVIHSMMKNVTDQIVDQSCSKELLPEEWDLDELTSILSTLSIHVNLTNKRRSLLELTDIKELVNTEISSIFYQLDYLPQQRVGIDLKKLLLATIDYHWLEHIEEMNRLKEGIGLRGYSQEDPIRIYNREAFQLFQHMYQSYERDVSIRFAKVITPLMNKSSH